VSTDQFIQANPTPAPKPARRPVFVIILSLAAGLLVVGLIAIQLVPVNHTNPPVTAPIKWNSAETEALARRACMDCHSNETVWPWYSNVAPASWLVYYDVVEARSRLNFSNMTLPNGPRGAGNQSGDLAYQFGKILAGGGSGEGPEGRFNPAGEGQRPQFNRTPQAGQAQPGGQFGGRPGGGAAREAVEQIQQGNMPPANYLMLHPDAKLTDAEKKQLIDGLTASMATASK
jgi:cytochrome c551/c552